MHANLHWVNYFQLHLSTVSILLFYETFTSHFSPRFFYPINKSCTEFLKKPFIILLFYGKWSNKFYVKIFSGIFLYHKFPLAGFTDNRRSNVFFFCFVLFLSFLYALYKEVTVTCQNINTLSCNIVDKSCFSRQY